MKLSELLMLNMRVEGNKEILTEALLRLPFFNDADKATLDMIEKAILKIRKKYPVTLAYIMPTPNLEEAYYSFMIKRTDDGKWLTTVYALSIYEGFAKTLLYMYGYAKNNPKGK